MNVTVDARLILRDDELEGGLELILLAESALWTAVDTVLEADGSGLGRSHWRAAFLLKRRPGAGVADLATMSGLSKQSASRTLSDLEAAGLAVKAPADGDGRRRIIALTDAGLTFEARVTDRLRTLLARAYRVGGLDGVAGARRILAALAGPRVSAGTDRGRRLD